MNLWKWRNLTLSGRVQILKTFITPKICYRTNIILLDATLLKAINRLFQFIWHGKDKIKRSVLTNNYEKGGLNMTNLDSYIKAQQIICLKKYWLDYPSAWKQVLNFHLKDYGGKFLL